MGISKEARPIAPPPEINREREAAANRACALGTGECPSCLKAALSVMPLKRSRAGEELADREVSQDTYR